MKIFKGTVVGTKSAKTATIAVTRFVTHPLYKKRMKRTKNYQVHDEIGVSVGTHVSFVASKPMSKTKKWKVLSIEGVKAKKAKK